MTSDLDLPDLTNLAYPVDDDGDHEGGGHCAWLPEDETDRWHWVLDQYLFAFLTLIDQAVDKTKDGSGDGADLSRPVLFAAHHTCEVAIKLALVTAGEDPPTGPMAHDLSYLKQHLDTGGSSSHLSAAEAGWVNDFIARMGAITCRGFDGRYPNAPADIADRWCCLNLDLLGQAVVILVGLLCFKGKG